MGNPKQKWTSEEEEALRAGVAKHGAGKWKLIQRDPEFNKLLFARSNIDLKDKWRNLNVASGQGPRDKSKTTKAKANPSEAPATPLPAAQTSASVVPSSQDASADVVMLESRQLPDGINAAKYNEMIFEALSTLKEPNGSDSGAIANFIEQRHSVPQNFKRPLSSRLRMLVQQDKLDKKLFLKLISGSIDAAEGLLNLKKLDAQWITPTAVTVQNCYKIKNGAPLETKSPTPRPKEPQRRPVQSIAYVGDTVEEAAESAAYKIAEAENKSFVAAEAMKEAERVARMAEEMEALLQFALDCYDQCADGGIVLIN